jgi:hypothetical protein
MKKKYLSVLFISTLLLTGCNRNQNSSLDGSVDLSSKTENSVGVSSTSQGDDIETKTPAENYRKLKSMVLASDSYRGNRTLEIYKPLTRSLEEHKENSDYLYECYQKDSQNNVISKYGFAQDDIAETHYCMKDDKGTIRVGSFDDEVIGDIVDDKHVFHDGYFMRAFYSEYSNLFLVGEWEDYLGYVSASTEITKTLYSMMSSQGTISVEVGDVSLTASKVEENYVYSMSQEYSIHMSMTQSNMLVNQVMTNKSTSTFTFDQEDRILEARMASENTATGTMKDTSDPAAEEIAMKPNSESTETVFAYSYPESYDCFVFPEEMSKDNDFGNYNSIPVVFEGNMVGSFSINETKPVESIEDNFIFYSNGLEPEMDKFDFTLYVDEACTKELKTDSTIVLKSDDQVYCKIKPKDDYGLIVHHIDMEITDYPEFVQLLHGLDHLSDELVFFEKDTAIDIQENHSAMEVAQLKDIDGNEPANFTIEGGKVYHFNYDLSITFAEAIMVYISSLFH